MHQPHYPTQVSCIHAVTCTSTSVLYTVQISVLGSTASVKSSNGHLVPTTCTLPKPGGTVPLVTYTPVSSLVPTPGSDSSPVSESPAGAIAGALVGVMVVVVAAVAVVLLVVLLLRRWQRKSPHEVDSQERNVDNPIYAGSVSLIWLLWGFSKER